MKYSLYNIAWRVWVDCIVLGEDSDWRIMVDWKECRSGNSDEIIIEAPVLKWLEGRGLALTQRG